LHGEGVNDARFGFPLNVITFLKEWAYCDFVVDPVLWPQVSDKLAVSAAVKDLGFIKWKRDLAQLSIKSSFQFNGLTMQDVYDESVDFEELINWTIDSVQNVLRVEDNPQEFTTRLPATVVGAFSYTPVKFFTLGVLSQTRFEGPVIRQATTLSGNLNFGNIFSATMAYTAANRRYDNLGFGMALRGGFLQFFVMVDNIPLKYSSFTSGEQTLRLPDNINTVNARLGLNLVFGNRERDKTLPPV